MTKIEFVRDIQRSFPQSTSAQRVQLANNVFSMYGEPEVDHETDPFVSGPSHVSYFRSPNHTFGVQWDYEEGFFVSLQYFGCACEGKIGIFNGDHPQCCENCRA